MREKATGVDRDTGAHWRVAPVHSEGTKIVQPALDGALVLQYVAVYLGKRNSAGGAERGDIAVNSFTRRIKLAEIAFARRKGKAGIDRVFHAVADVVLVVRRIVERLFPHTALGINPGATVLRVVAGVACVL